MMGSFVIAGVALIGIVVIAAAAELAAAQRITE